MSNDLDSYAQPANTLESLQRWYDPLSKKYPCLAKALAGNEWSRTTEAQRPPFQIGFSTKGDSLRFTLYSNESSRTYFGVIDDPSEPWEAAERCLREGNGEWSEKPKDWSSKRRS